MTERFRIGSLLVLITTTLAIAATGAVVWRERPSAAAPNIAGPFKFTDANTGELVTNETCCGKTRLIYFGYTYCPDACPTALNNISKAMAKLGPKGKRRDVGGSIGSTPGASSSRWHRG
jgi:protein SCO1/2